MKEIVKLFLSDVGAWTAIGISGAVALIIFLTSRSAGKIIGTIVAGLLIAYFCWNPETVMNKTSEILNLLVNMFKIGG
ncbi:TcpD family membrane protein [Streptococcus sanguinis]|uniref:TcpD family membrane protein n=1 Tax=Streptococcus sanguinis TaxID=1305 RepID=UPI001CBDC970|nr:TcpD family membrane protein [Streptococcus sanguinis]MBZ2021413.1 hypothetical protein [Streptococcus sanguinis]MBZ2073742.1 hypothetical protein [Streptococcus sanguinis]MBZ2081665.1 hypothetical protein [Streptococcus sanguinis]MCC3165743.1 putative membrane protein [Streptococcus sanguinis]